MNTKYELIETDTKLSLDGKTLFRVRAKTDIVAVLKGELGGYVSSELNLSIAGDAWVYGNAQVYGDARVQFGNLVVDFKANLKAAIVCSLNIYPIDGVYTLYKRVHKIAKGEYHSCYDSHFLYRDGTESSVNNPNESPDMSCSSGIHVSTPFYTSEGDTLIAVSVKFKDIICCLSGKVRCRKVTTIGEVRSDKDLI